MSIQEERFAQIAAAIREKDGTTAPIRALDFAERIRAIQTGGGGCGFAVPLVVTVEAGATVTATHGETTVTATSGTDGTATLVLTAPGVWGVTASLDGIEKSTEVEISTNFTVEIMLLSPFPVGYTQVEYISPAPTVYSFVMTDMLYPNVAKIHMDIQPESYSQGYDGAQYFLFASNALGIWRYPASTVRYRAGSTTTSNFSYSVPSTRFDFLFDSVARVIRFGDEKEQSISCFQTEITYPIGILGNAEHRPLPCKLYSCKFYDKNDLLLCDFAPCKDPDNSIGLFDIKRKMFFAGSTNMTAGPTV